MQDYGHCITRHTNWVVKNAPGITLTFEAQAAHILPVYFGDSSTVLQEVIIGADNNTRTTFRTPKGSSVSTHNPEAVLSPGFDYYWVHLGRTRISYGKGKEVGVNTKLTRVWSMPADIPQVYIGFGSFFWAITLRNVMVTSSPWELNFDGYLGDLDMIISTTYILWLFHLLLQTLNRLKLPLLKERSTSSIRIGPWNIVKPSLLPWKSRQKQTSSFVLQIS